VSLSLRLLREGNGAVIKQGGAKQSIALNGGVGYERSVEEAAKPLRHLEVILRSIATSSLR
jgi:hypothetical protein